MCKNAVLRYRMLFRYINCTGANFKLSNVLLRVLSNVLGHRQLPATMKTCLVLCVTVLAVSLTQASVTYRQLLKLAKPADDSVKADHEIQLGELDDEVDFQSILKQMGHDFSFEESNDGGMESNIELGELESIMIPDGSNTDLDDSLKSDECACSGKTCVCCNVLTFTYEGKRYYIYLCGRITYISSSRFLVELVLQGTRVRYAYVTQPTNVYYRVNSAFSVGCYVDKVSSDEICFYLYFVVNGKAYKCAYKCLKVPASSFGTDLKISDD